MSHCKYLNKLLNQEHFVLNFYSKYFLCFPLFLLFFNSYHLCFIILIYNFEEKKGNLIR